MINHLWLLAAPPDEDWIKLVTYAIGGVILVGGWVMNHLKQMAEKRAAEERARRKLEEFGRQVASQGAADRPKSLPTADDLAMHRRQQLQELAQQRRQAAGQPLRQTTPKPEPDNLTLSQARERQRAVEAYRRRAEALEQQRRQQAVRQRQPSSPPRQQPPTSRPAARTPQPTPSRTLSHKPVSERLAIERRHIASQVATVATRHIHSQIETPSEHASLTSPAVAPAGHPAFHLRQAIIWKEILDQPVSLREAHLV